MWRCLKRPEGPAHPERYAKEVPGDRVQIATVKIGKGLSTALPPIITHGRECSRSTPSGTRPRRPISSGTTCSKELPFPIQNDRGGEFSGTDFRLALMQERIRFRPARTTPHLTGKVERSQRTDRVEYCATADLGAPDFTLQLEGRQPFYNEVRRPHGDNGVRPPLARTAE